MSYADNHYHMAFHSLQSEEDAHKLFELFTQTLPDEVSSYLMDNFMKYYRTVKSQIPYSNKPEEDLNQWIDSLKDDKEKLSQLAALCSEEINHYSENPITIKLDFRGRYNSIFGAEGQQLDPLHFWQECWKPRRKYLIQALYALNRVSTREDALCIVTAVTSVASIYNDLRFISKEAIHWDSMRIYNGVYNQKVDNNKVYKESYLTPYFHDFINNVLLGDMSDFDLDSVSLNKYVRELKKAIKRNYQRYDVRSIQVPMYITTKSTCTRCKVKVRCKDKKIREKWITMPGYLASAYEHVPKEISDIKYYGNLVYTTEDQIIINDNVIPGYYGKCIRIDQNSKYKGRGIHPTTNRIQEPLSFYEEFLARIMRSYKPDCTFAQWYGYRSVQRATNPTLEPEWSACLSLDLTMATDTWCVQNQAEVLCTMLQMAGVDPAEAAQMTRDWITLMEFPDSVKLTGKEEILTMPSGQPQGKISSFKVFAMSHHISLLFVIYLMCLLFDGLGGEFTYFILGDDMFIAFEDEEDGRRFKDLYIAWMAEIGVECNPNKGYTWFKSSGKPRIAEFAKVLCLDGNIITPMPLRLCIQCHDADSEIRYYVWRASYDPSINLEKVVSIVNRKYGTAIDPAVAYALVDIILLSQNMSRRYYEEVDDTLFSKIMYFYDYWAVRDSVLRDILTSEERDALPVQYRYDEIVARVVKQMRMFKPYFEEQRHFGKVEAILSEEVVKGLLIDHYKRDISPEETDYLNALLSVCKVNAVDMANALDDALDILGVDPEEVFEKQEFHYERSSVVASVLNKLRDRSFAAEMHYVVSSKLSELSNLVSPFADDDFGIFTECIDSDHNFDDYESFSLDMW